MNAPRLRRLASVAARAASRLGWIASSALLLLAACADLPLPDALRPPLPGAEGAGRPVAFAARLPLPDADAESRGAPVTGPDYPLGESFGVLAYSLPEAGWRPDLLPDFMYNRRVERQPQGYYYQPLEYWPVHALRFFAYHPYATPANGITLSPANRAGAPTLSFEVAAEVVDQIDLLAAAPPAVVAPAALAFPFVHALTRVAFVVRSARPEARLHVVSIVLRNIIGAGTLSLVPRPDGALEWTPSAQFNHVREYRLALPTADGGEQGLLAPDEQQIFADRFSPVCSPRGTLFLIPQPITPGRSLLVVRFSIDGREHTREMLLPPTQPGEPGEWSSGKYIRYQLTLGAEAGGESIDIDARTAQANCILLDPQPRLNSAAAYVDYSIPVAHANTFYTHPAFAPWNDGSPPIATTDGWGVGIIWMDRANLMSIVKPTGRGAMDDADGRFVVRIPVGNQGNALMGIYRDANANGQRDAAEPWMWSWHLWVTDYDPNRPVNPAALTPAAAHGSWPVQNGAIHRYRPATLVDDPATNNGSYGSLDVWQPHTGLYAGKAMMDRNVGSVSDRFPPLENNIPFDVANINQRKAPLHVLYYEYGRKDPFLSDAYRYQQDGTALNTIAFEKLPVPLIYSIRNPEVYIHDRQSWAIDKPLNCYWYDPRHEATEDRSATTGLKSLFDPCPAGWRLPVNGTWSDFSHATFAWATGRRGRTYRPMADGFEAFYPAEGFRAASTGEVKQTGYHGIYWTCSPIPFNNKDYCFRFSSTERNVPEGDVFFDTIWPSAAVFQTDSFSVRCVQE